MRKDEAPYATRPLKLLVIAALVLPVALLAYHAFATYERHLRLKDERLEGLLDVLQEHSLKVFQTTDRLLFEADGLLRTGTDAAIRLREPDIHAELRGLQAALPEVQAIWAFDRDGRPLASSTVFPVPPSLNNADRDYFQAHLQDPSAGTFVGSNIAARVNVHTFFVVSRRRSAPDSRFAGVVALTVPPTSLNAFYEKLTRGTALAANLLGADGRLLARHPPPPGGFVGARANDAFPRLVAADPERGSYRALSGFDGADRWIGYRRVPGTPVYVTASYDVATFRRDFLRNLARDAAIGFPAALLFALVSWLALRRTQALVGEFDRRRTAEVALKESQRLEALGQLTGGVAHDFNNLLMVVRGNVERVLRGLPPDRQQRALASVLDAARTGEKLTRQLLTFSRRQRVAPESIDLHERLTRLGELLRNSLRPDIGLSVDVAPGTWPVRVDPAELDLAILNLAVNARDAMPGTGSFRLRAANAAPGDVPQPLSGEFVLLRASDTGEGIADDILSKVFDPFFTTKSVGQGTGLGLSQVYGFAHQAGGAARIASRLGAGTTVSLLLPRSLEPAASTRIPAPSAPEAADHARRGLALLVEDNPAVAELIEAAVQECGYDVLLRPDAESGIATAETRDDLALVVSDVMTPGPRTGIDLARSVRASRPHLPVILVTGFSAAALQARQEGLTILSKPFSAGELREAVLAATVRPSADAASG